MNAGKPQEEWNPEEVELKSEKDQIKFDDFDKVEIRVAEVKEVEKVEGSDKLLRFRLDAGDGEDRQILSGIAKFYPNEQELVGKKLQVVANLKPRKMMKKYVSQGMILSANMTANSLCDSRFIGSKRKCDWVKYHKNSFINFLNWKHFLLISVVSKALETHLC
ncbi:MAG: methionine--tRNA ligase subunit beta [Streptococcus salivarius]